MGKNSSAPAAISAAGSFASNIVAAAVNPLHTAPTNGQPQLNAFSSPSIIGPGQNNMPSWLNFNSIHY